MDEIPTSFLDFVRHDIVCQKGLLGMYIIASDITPPPLKISGSATEYYVLLLNHLVKIAIQN